MRPFNTKLLTITIIAGFTLFLACDTVNSDTEPHITRKALESLQLKNKEVVIDLAQSFPNHRFNKVMEAFADRVTTVPGADGDIRFVRYNPGESFDEQFVMELENAAGEPVLSTLKVQEANESQTAENCRENTLEATIDRGSELILDLFDEEDFCGYKEKIDHIAIAGTAFINRDDLADGNMVEVYLDENNPENNLLYYRFNTNRTHSPGTYLGAYSVAINYPDSLKNNLDLVFSDPEYSEVLVHRVIEITIE